MKFIISSLKKFFLNILGPFLYIRNKLFLNKVRRDFGIFCEALEKGNCSICGFPIQYINYKKPCLHWLLRPDNINKDHISELLLKIDYLRVEAYIKWAANCELAFGNINDLVEIGQSQKIIEYTTRYKNLEWSVSCSESDFAGHESSQYGVEPHYHFQMRINKKPFFDYTDLHIPFKPSDLFMFQIKKNEFFQVKWIDGYGTGMQGLMEKFTGEELVNMMSAGTENVEKAIFRTQTLITAKEGEKISSVEILRILEESENKNVSVGSLAKTVKGAGHIEYFVSPGEGVPEKAKRARGRGQKSK